MRSTKSEEEISTIKEEQIRINKHIHIALKDVQVLQADVGQFKEHIEKTLKEETDQIHSKWTQLKISMKQAQDMINELQKQSNVTQDDVKQSFQSLSGHQEYLEQLNRRIVSMETIKLDEVFFAEHEKVVNQRIFELKAQISDIGNKLMNTDNYIEKYQPFNWFCQMFEILRLTLEYPQMAKIKEYEQYRLKQLYDVILSDDGVANYDKQFMMQPSGFSLNQLKDTNIKVTAKNRRILQKPSISNARFSCAIGGDKAQKESLQLQVIDSQQKKRHQSFAMPQITGLSNNRTIQSGVNNERNLIDEVQEQSSESESENELNIEEFADKIEDLMDYDEHEDGDSSQGLKNLNYLKKKMFDPEVALIMKQFDSKFKQCQDVLLSQLQSTSENLRTNINEKITTIESFKQEIDSSQKGQQQHQYKIMCELDKFSKKIDKLQNHYNYLELTFKQPESPEKRAFSSTANTTSHYSQVKSRNIFCRDSTTKMTNLSQQAVQFTPSKYTAPLKHFKTNLVVKGFSRLDGMESSVNEDEFSQTQILESRQRPVTAFRTKKLSKVSHKSKIQVDTLRHDASEQPSLLL